MWNLRHTIHLICMVLAIHGPVDCQLQCNQDLLDQSFVTYCGQTSCEFLFGDSESKNKSYTDEWPTSNNEVVHIASSRAGDRFKVNRYKSMDTNELFYEQSRVNGSIFVDTNVKYQRVLGFGTTLTDASSTNVDSLPDPLRLRLISDYFSTDAGIGMNLIKVPIGSTKYSFTNYVLDQPTGNRLELSPYDIDHRIPLIKEAVRSAGRFRNRVKVLASSLTAPPECKQNGRIVQGGWLKRNKIQDYAQYLSSFVETYADQGVNVWSLILSESPVLVQLDKGINETLDYNSMAMRPSDCVELIKSIDKLKSTGEFNSINAIRLVILGDDRANIPVWSDAVFKHPDVAKRVAGVVYKCDSSLQSPYDNLVYVNKRYQGKYLLTEGSVHTPMKLGNWQYGENYATEMVKNLEFGSVAWIDFNMALNLDGGPWISSKFKADAAVVVDPKKGAYYRNPMFYAIGHLSRYVRPGSVRVKADIYSSAHMYSRQHIAFVTPENYLVVFVMNNNIGPMPINIGIGTRTKVEVLLDTKSFNTFLFKL